MYNIECYNEEVFKKDYKEKYEDVSNIIERHGIDIEKYDFIEYVSAGNTEEIIYELRGDSDVTLYIEYHDDVFQRCELSRD